MSQVKEAIARGNPRDVKRVLNIRGDDTDLDVSAFAGALSSNDTTVQAALDTLDDHAHAASEITTTTTNFNGILSGTENTSQKALDVLDDINASSIPATTTNFDGLLSSADNTVQKALDTLDDITTGGRVYLTSLTASASATLDYDAFSTTYRMYEFLLDKIRPATDDADLYCRLKVGGTPRSTASDYQYHVESERAGDTTRYTETSLGDTQLILTESQANLGAGNTSGQGIDGLMDIIKPGTASYRKTLGWRLRYPNISSQDRLMSNRGDGILVGSSAALSGIQWFFDSGNIADGSIHVYGII